MYMPIIYKSGALSLVPESEFTEAGVAIALVVRTTYTNKVLVCNNEIAQLLDHEYSLDKFKSQGYNPLEGNFNPVHFAMFSISNFLREQFKLPNGAEFMPKSIIQPAGVLIDNPYRYSITLHYRLIIPDQYVNEFEPIDPMMKVFFQDINSLTFTNFLGWSNILLPTLKIVRGDNV
jgi:hypothetical protein